MKHLTPKVKPTKKLKRRVDFNGLPVHIEYEGGDLKQGDGWQMLMKNAYGYIPLHVDGSDGEYLDAFLGSDTHAKQVYIIDLNKPDGGHDEQKVMLGFSDKKYAEQVFDSHYTNSGARGKTWVFSFYEFHGYLRDETRSPQEKIQVLEKALVEKARQSLAANRRSVEKYRNNPKNKQKVRAHWRVKDAVKSGKLKAPDKCPKCGGGGRLQFHHAHGYEKGDQLKGKWLCPTCHQNDPKNRKKMSASIKKIRKG